MGKRTRIVLYALSLVILLAMVTLIIFSWGKQHSEPVNDAMSETVISSTEEPVQIPEAEESEETEAADGQNLENLYVLTARKNISWFRFASSRRRKLW